MKNLSFFIFSALLSCGLIYSAAAFDLPSSFSYSHTTELKPIPNSFQIAKSTFLPDRFEDLGLSDYDTLGNDYNIGNCDDYPLTSCPAGSLCQACPFNARRYRSYSCKAPYTFVNGKCTCPQGVALSNPNDKCTQYCGNTCIKKSCTPSTNQTDCTNGTQSCDNGCGQNTRQCCVACTNKITSKPANATYTYSDCYDGSNKRIQTGWVCNSGFHQKGSACEKDCNNTPCSGFTLSSCPSGYTCEKCTKTATDCTTSGTYYKLIGCPTGQLDLNNYWCGGALKCWLK